MVQNEIFKSAVFLLDHVHHWILLLINYSEKASEQFKNRASILASYETYSSQDTASTTAVAGRRSKQTWTWTLFLFKHGKSIR